MKKAITVALLGMVFAGFAAAQNQSSVELDLDGVVGNGPDNVFVSVSDYIDVDVWLTGDPHPLVVVSIGICNVDGSLEFQGFQYAFGLPWTVYPPEIDGSCAWIWAFDPSFMSGTMTPILFGTATYHAAVDGSLDDLTISSDSAWLGFYGYTYFFTDNVGASIQIGGVTSAEESSWGGVKSLFR